VPRSDLDRRLDEIQAAVAEPDRFEDADVAFHAAVLAASGNELLEQLLGAIDVALRFGRAAGSPPPGTLSAHARAVEAIRSGDGDAAEAAMRKVVAGEARGIPTAAGPPP
jgi:DNA-binding FadR family transcriptional regulator